MRRKILFLLVVSLFLFLCWNRKKDLPLPPPVLPSGLNGSSFASSFYDPVQFYYDRRGHPEAFQTLSSALEHAFRHFPCPRNLCPSSRTLLRLPYGSQINRRSLRPPTPSPAGEADYLLAVSSSPSPMFLSYYAFLARSVRRPELAPAAFCAVYGGIFFTGLFLRLIRGSQPFSFFRNM